MNPHIKPDKLNRAIKTSLQHLVRDGELVYTERQLYYEVCRQLRAVPGIEGEQVPKALVASTLFGLLFFKRPRLAANLVTLGALIIQGLRLIRKLPFTLPPPISIEDFDHHWAGFTALHGLPKMMLTSPSSPTIVSRAAEPDLFDYGVAQTLICQHPQVADMLRTNYVHMTLSGPILSLAEATPLPEPIQQMLARTPQACIYYLHDASVMGLTQIMDLSAQLAVEDQWPIWPIGLRPAQAQNLHLFGQYHPETGATLTNLPEYVTSRERQWLASGWYTETEALPPVALMRGLRRIILGNRAQTGALTLQQKNPTEGLTWPAEG